MMKSVAKVQDPIITLRYDANLLVAVSEIVKHYQLSGFHNLSLAWADSIAAWRLVVTTYDGESLAFLVRYDTGV